MSSKMEDLIYPNLPVALQNAACSYYGWRAARARYSEHFYSQLESLKKSEWWSHEEIRNFQDLKVRELYQHAINTVPFYRSLYKSHGLTADSVSGTEDLRKLPILEKAIARDQQKAMISEAFRKGSLPLQSTSGTTGTPITVPFTIDGLAFQWAIWWRHKSRFGLKPDDKHLSFTGKSMVPAKQKKPPYWRHDIFGHRVCLSVYHISDLTVQPILEYLNSKSFAYFTGASSGMYTLSNALEKNGLHLINKPKMIVSGADLLLPKFSESFERNFGAAVTEQYGMVEFAANMAKCEKGNFHTDFECGYIESIPIENTPFHKLILTGWGNPAMPFIRYEVGDLAIPMKAPCPCGRQSASYKSIDGRLEDFIVTPDGRRLMGMNQVLQYAENAKEIQIYQEREDLVEFRIIPGENFGDSDKEALAREFTKRAGSGVAISFKVVDTLDRSSSGKLRAVVSIPARKVPF